MAIVSASLPDALVADMDAAIASGAYKGRSEFLRAAVRDYLQASHPPAGRHVHGSVTVVYPHGKEARISEVRHAFHDVVLSLMHTHCEEETCMDVLIVGGAPERLAQLQATLERMRDVKRSRLVVMA
jgi:CopG family transcriptional regulator, nickel-responsive regulator